MPLEGFHLENVDARQRGHDFHEFAECEGFNIVNTYINKPHNKVGNGISKRLHEVLIDTFESWHLSLKDMFLTCEIIRSCIRERFFSCILSLYIARLYSVE